jgi:PBSX family phage terminase large subunit
VTNDLALAEIEKLPPCDVLISGYSISSVARNVMAEWKKMLDPNDRGYFRNMRDEKDDYLVIENPEFPGFYGKKFYIRGAGKEHDFKQIQGSTLGYWLADELTRHTKSFVDMAITRLSPAFAKAIWTTNPDSPHHFVKKDILDKKELFKVGEDGTALFKRWTFFLDDNPSLTDDYKDSLRRVHTGVFYKRNVLSMWVMAEGAIYDGFDETIHTKQPDDLPKVPGMSWVWTMAPATRRSFCFSNTIPHRGNPGNRKSGWCVSTTTTAWQRDGRKRMQNIRLI